MILPGSTVKVTDENSIYRGYVGCVQRIQGKKLIFPLPTPELVIP